MKKSDRQPGNGDDKTTYGMEKSKSLMQPSNCEVQKLSLKGDNSTKSYPRPAYFEPLMKKSASKSEDSLDSGIYSRQKSCDSMDSLDSNDGAEPTMRLKFPPAGATTATMPTPTAEEPFQQHFDDYWRELREVEDNESSSSSGGHHQHHQATSSTGDEDDDREANWLRMAGFAPLLRASDAGGASSSSSDKTGEDESDDDDNDSLSSMTVLSTLTKPQREAVLRRVTSFNRVQKKKSSSRQIQSIETIFNVEVDGEELTPKDDDDDQELPPTKPHKSASLPRGATAPDIDDPTAARRSGELGGGGGGVTDADGATATRRYSDASSSSSLAVKQETSFAASYKEPKSRKSFSKRSFKGFKLKKGVVAGDTSKGIEGLKIRTRDDGETSPTAEKQVSYSETAVATASDHLPNFSLVKDMLGVTRIDDLHQHDMRKVQSLAYIELTALLDRFGIELKRRKVVKNKVKDAGVFGVALTTLVKRDRQRLEQAEPAGATATAVRVPLALCEIIDYLERHALDTEGILRKSGSTARVKLLKQELNARFGADTVPSSSAPVAPAWGDAHPHDVASLLKQLLRELPDPLLTNMYIDAFQSCEMIADRKEQLQALNLLVILLNPTHRDSLRLLLTFLNRVVEHEASNKMSLNNVAMITAPNLFLPAKQPKKGDHTASTTERNIKQAAGTSSIVRMLIKYHQLLWTVPAFMLSQVRTMNAGINEKKNQHHNKHKMKLFKGVKDHSAKKSSISPVIRGEVDTQRKVVKIHADDMSITSITVKLTHTLVVNDLFAKFQRQVNRMHEDSGSSEKPPVVIDVTTHSLYEMGGNLHERRLDPNANVYALVCTNPHANFVLRPATTTGPPTRPHDNGLSNSTVAGQQL